MKNPTYDRITDRIIALLEQGTVPWQKPWKARTGLPRNFVSKNPYRGINVFLLLAMRYESPFWLTFRQVSSLAEASARARRRVPLCSGNRRPLKTRNQAREEKISASLLSRLQCQPMRRTENQHRAGAGKCHSQAGGNCGGYAAAADAETRHDPRLLFPARGLRRLAATRTVRADGGLLFHSLSRTCSFDRPRKAVETIRRSRNQPDSVPIPTARRN